MNLKVVEETIVKNKIVVALEKDYSNMSYWEHRHYKIDLIS